MRSRYCLLLLSLISFAASAQFPYAESFQNATASNMVIAGSAKLTAATGTDPVGQGYLRLTDNSVNNVGYAYCQQSFPSTYGISASFEFFMWKSDALGYNQADGISFFLYDASLNSFRPGGTGGSLGYANYYTTPGMAKGYLGIALDGFGNYSNPGDGNKPGGPGKKAGSVVIRGPGNGVSSTDYVYQTGVTTSDPAYNASFLGFTQRYPLATSANYRKVDITLKPGSSLGAAGFTITVKMIKGGSPTTSVTLISNYDYPFAAPANLRFGVAASTGSIFNYQEIRNMTMNVTNTTSLINPALLPDVLTICSGTGIINVLQNDASLNSNGSMNKTSIDLDPLTAGRQTTFTDAGKGTYTVDSSGIVSFTSQSGFSGISTINYTAADNYGATPLLPTAIVVTVNATLAPLLAITDPVPVCAPASIDISSAAYRTSTSIGASYDYFPTLTDANNNTSSINSSASSIATAGTYYIRASLLGCATVRPINVQINSAPSVSNAGSDITSCSSTGGFNATLLATNPAVGGGSWSQVNGTNSVAVNFLNAATTPLMNLPQGIYTYRWTVSNGACAVSSDDVVITVGVPANAGPAQTICNATVATLSGNLASPGIGLWTKTAGPSLTIANTSLANAGVSGLIPGNSYTMQWKITNGVCVNTSSVIITDVLNTIANAGVDQAISLPTTTLAGNVTDAGNTGTWTLVSSPPGSNPIISQINNPLSAISGLNYTGNYTFRWTMVNGTFSNADEMTINVVSLLPVNLISFTGHLQDTRVLLQWQTASESDNDRFDIERSIDGIHFTFIGTVPGHNNSNILQDYQFADPLANVTAKTVYYRLRQVDRDNRSSFSPVVKIDLPALESVVVTPNPFIDHFTVNITVNNSGSGKMSIFTANGQLYRQTTIHVVKGSSQFEIKDLKGLSPGVISLRVETPDGIINKQLLKQ
jgi:hypothetical protein